LRRGDTDTHIRYIHDRVPVAAELPNLLGIDLQQQVGAMSVGDRASVHVWDLDAAT
jgi:hypothetical protein